MSLYDNYVNKMKLKFGIIIYGKFEMIWLLNERFWERVFQMQIEMVF